MLETQVANQFLEKARKSSWGNPVVADKDDSSGSVMPGEGQLLYGFIRALKPEIILEIGTSYGGSTLYLAAGCKDNNFGKVHTVEIDSYRQSQAQYHTEQAKVKEWIEFYNVIPALPQIDFVFLDAGHTAKEVVQYLGEVKDKLSKNALVLVHDATWQNHTEQVAKETGFNYLILPNTSYAGMAILWLTTTQLFQK